MLSQASTAFHVLVIVLTHELPAVTSAPTIFTVAVVQASVAVGAGKRGQGVPSMWAAAPAAPALFTVPVLQASVAVGAVKVGVAVHSIVAAAPAAPITGACVSESVTVWATVPLVLPQASTAFHVLVIVRTHELPAVTSA